MNDIVTVESLHHMREFLKDPKSTDELLKLFLGTHPEVFRAFDESDRANIGAIAQELSIADTQAKVSSFAISQALQGINALINIDDSISTYLYDISTFQDAPVATPGGIEDETMLGHIETNTRNIFTNALYGINEHKAHFQPKEILSLGRDVLPRLTEMESINPQAVIQLLKTVSSLVRYHNTHLEKALREVGNNMDGQTLFGITAGPWNTLIDPSKTHTYPDRLIFGYIFGMFSAEDMIDGLKKAKTTADENIVKLTHKVEFLLWLKRMRMATENSLIEERPMDYTPYLSDLATKPFSQEINTESVEIQTHHAQNLYNLIANPEKLINALDDMKALLNTTEKRELNFDTKKK